MAWNFTMDFKRSRELKNKLSWLVVVAMYFFQESFDIIPDN